MLLRLEIDLAGDVPIYRQIRDQIVRGAASGAIAPGEQLPTVRQLAADLGVNPMTVNKAYAMLKAEGMIAMNRRRGAQLCDITSRRSGLDDSFDSRALQLIAEARAKGVPKQELLTRITLLADDLYNGEGETK